MITKEQHIRQEAALTGAHHDYEKGLTLHAFFKLHDHAMSEDLVQSTFLKTWSYLLKGGNIEVMKAFLYHVLNNLIVDEYRKKKAVSLDVLLEKGIEPSAVGTDRLLDFLDGKAATLLIERLPHFYQEVMRMRYLQDLSLNEISFMTGRSKNSVAVQTHRALQKLRLMYGTTR